MRSAIICDPLSSFLWQHFHFTFKHNSKKKKKKTPHSDPEQPPDILQHEQGFRWHGIQLISFLPQIERTKKWETWIRACVSQLARLRLIPYRGEKGACREKCCSERNPDGFVQRTLRFQLHYLRGTWSPMHRHSNRARKSVVIHVTVTVSNEIPYINIHRRSQARLSTKQCF